jgi:hypothetical protein
MLYQRHLKRQACAAPSNFPSYLNITSRIIGFEELGNVDSFSTATLELRLQHTGSGVPNSRVHDLILRFQVLSKKILISCLLLTMHELLYPAELAYARIAMMTTMTTLTFEYCIIHLPRVAARKQVPRLQKNQ